MVMHACEMPNGNFWEKKVAQAAINALGPEDYCGVVYWGAGGDTWMWGGARGFLPVGANRATMLGRIGRMIPGDMPDFAPSMQLALNGFAQLPQAAVKHMIIISDGDPSPPPANLLAQFRNARIKVTTVAIGTHGAIDQQTMQTIARSTGGKYYNVKSAAALPKIYQTEVRRISRSLIYEREQPFAPKIQYPHEIIKGIDGSIPPIKGFVLTTVKDQAEVALYSPVPATDRNSTILAAWIYGLGKTVALTTDVGERWATTWPAWENYDKLMTQMVRWSMRPSGQPGEFTVSTDVRDGKARIVVTALDKDDEFINFLNLTGTAIGPDLRPLPVTMRQTAPGRYVGELDVADAGSYMISLSPGPSMGQIRTGLNVGYSSEFRDRQTNTSLLQALASVTPKDGEPGKIIDGQSIDELLATNPYRRDFPLATSRQDIWPLLLLCGGCLFFFDVFIRRVAVNFNWVPPALAYARDTILRRDHEPVETPTMDRLRSRKAEVSQQLEARHAKARFDLQRDAPPTVSAIEEELAGPGPAAAERKRPSAGDLSPGAPAEEEEGYTSRLLKAKKKVWEDREKDKK
jgi:hypothetical protein